MTAIERPFGCILTAMVTPFGADGAVDLEAAGRLAEHLCDHGNDGLVVLGTTGESPTITGDEATGLVRAVVEAVGHRAHVVAGAGSYDTADSIERIRGVEAAGAHGALLVTPYYSRPPQEGLAEHFRAVADASGLPVMLYDIPVRSCVKLSHETLLRAAEHPRIVAVKDASGDFTAGAAVMAEAGLAYYSGDDAANLPWLALGAAGMVSTVGNVAGEAYAALAAAVDAGDLATARRINLETMPLVEVIMNRQGGAIRAKAALQMMGVLDNRAMRLPLVPASEDDLAELRTTLSAAGYLA